MKKLIAILLSVAMCIGLFAGCAQKNEDLTKAKEYLYSLYVDKSTETATDLEYPARVKGGSTFFDVEWTVEIISGTGEIKVVESENPGFVVVDVPAEPAEDIVYKLTATIKDAEGKQTETLTYEYTVPKFTLTSFAEYAAAESGTLVVVQGVVTAILSKTNGDSSNSLYFQDNDGGFYAYNLATDPVADGIEIGMTVRVTGEKDLYNGTYEIVSGTAEIISADKTPATPADWTEVFKNAADLKDATLTAQQSFLVTLKGVEITKQEDKYLKFKLGDKETYIYISSSNCPGTAAEEAAMVATYNEKSGNLANVTGLVTLYNGSFYLTPCGPDAFEYLGLPEKSDAELVEYEKNELTFPASVSKNTEIELPATGATFDKVAIAWTVAGEGAAIVDGKLVLTVGEKTSTATVTATLTCGDITDTATFEIKIWGTDTGVTMTQTNTLNNGDKVVIYYPDSQLAISAQADGKKLVGVEAVLNGTSLIAHEAAIMEVVVDANGYYTFICDGKYLTAGETGNSLSWADAASDFSLWTLEAADGGYYIKSVNAAYNGNAQYVEYYNAFTTYGFNETKTNIYLFQFFLVTEDGTTEGGNTEDDKTEDKDGKKVTIAEAIAIAKKAGAEGTTIKYTITGKVTEVQNATYGNFIVEDSTGSILVYGCYDAKGNKRYDAMDKFPQVGDTVTLYGVLVLYTSKDGVETPEMKNAWCKSGGTGKHETEDNKTEDEDGKKLTIAEAIAICNKAGNTATTIKYTITGKVTEVQNTTYGNLIIEDSTGSILIYGCYDAKGDKRYDAMDNFPQVGDTVTLYGVLMSYNGETPQMKSAWCLSGGTGKRETEDNTTESKEDKSYTTAPQTGVAYKLGLYQGNNGENLYFTGNTTNYEWYMATTTEKSDAVDVYLEEVDGGYRIYFDKDGTKTYLDMYTDGEHYSLRLTTEPTAVYTWNSEYNTLVSNIEGVDCYIGTYGTYKTMSASKLEYISSSFPTHLFP